MKAIFIYAGYTKAITNNWDIRPSVTIKVSLAIISWIAGHIHMIKLALESSHQLVSEDIWYIPKQ